MKRLIATVTCLAAVVAACGAEGQTDAQGNSTGLADMEPVEITVQNFYGPDNWVSKGMDAYTQAVEKASGGKITFDTHYSLSLVSIGELEEGLDSGLIDLALHIPLYHPETFPINATMSDLGFLGAQTPLVGTLQSAGAFASAGFSDEHVQELESHGIKPLIPMLSTAPNLHLLCRDEPVTDLSSAQGTRVRFGGAAYRDAAAALGMEPVEILTEEVYEAFQRGVFDCYLGDPTIAPDVGLFELAEHFTVDSKVPFAGLVSMTLGFNLDLWESLPLEAQQLLWDEAGDTFLRTLLKEFFAVSANVHRQALDEGIEYHEWGQDARDTLTAHYDSVLDQVTERLGEYVDDSDEQITSLLSATDEWHAIVTDELGYSDDQHRTWMEFAKQNPEGAVDVDPFVDRFVETYMDPRRP